MEVSWDIRAAIITSEKKTAERSEASTAFGLSNVEIAGSNLARGMDVCLRFSVVLSCVGRGLASGRLPIQGVLPIVYRFTSKNPSTRKVKEDD
jgi:hypothetical protein